MNLRRIRREVRRARKQFAHVELWDDDEKEDSLCVRVALQPSAGSVYLATISLLGYPNKMPEVEIDKPSLVAGVPHRYSTGNICYLHPSMWNPGRHDLKHVIARTAKWLNKYEVWRTKHVWPGAEQSH